MFDAFQELKNLLKNHQRFVIVSHKSPDGDAIGSSAAWFHFLKSLGKEAFIALPDTPSDVLLTFLDGSDHAFYDTNKGVIQDFAQKAEVMFCLDFNGSSRVGESMQSFIEGFDGKKCMIDHHPEPDTFTDISISDIKSSSTCQLLFECIENIELLNHINLIVAKNLYLGIMTDTGSFRYPSVNAKTHEILSFLLNLGLPHFEIHEQIFDNNRLDQLKLRGFAINNKLTIHPNCPMAFISLTKEELANYNYQQGDTEGLVNVVLSIEGIKMAVLIQEKIDGIKMSFRSKGEIFVNQLAKQYFHGGGHKYAAGGISHDNMDKTIQNLISLTPSLFK